VIGFSLLHDTLELDLGLIWQAKKYSSATLVAGGIEATFNSELVQRYSPVDHVVYGEGEYPLLSLCNGDEFQPCRPLSQEEFREVSLGINFKDVPFGFLWQLTEKRHPTISTEECNTIRLITSSHCPMGCTFCSSTNFLKGSVKYLEAEDIRQLIERGVEAWPQTKQIFFQDDTFMLGRRGVKRCQELNEMRLPVKFMAQTRLDDITPKSVEHIGFLRLLSVGVESFSQNILDEFNKKMSADEVEGRLELLLDSGTECFVNIILTSPNCTVEDVRLTLSKCEEWVDRGVGFGINLYVGAYPGTEIVETSPVTYETVNIPNTDIKFKKMIKLLPQDKTVRNAVLRTEEELESAVLPSRDRSRRILNLMNKHLD